MSDFDFDTLEHFIVHGLLADDEYCGNFLEKMDPSHFSQGPSIIIKVIKQYNSLYHKIPDAGVIEHLIKKNAKTDKDKEIAVETLEGVTMLSFDRERTKDWLYSETKRFIKKRRVMSAVVKAVEHIEKNEDDTVLTLIEDAFKISFDDRIGLDYWDDLDERLAKSKEKIEIISTGYPSIDKACGGGYRRKSMFVFAGPANTGKTLFLNDAATTMSLHGYNVLYLTLELPEGYIAARTDARISEIGMDSINVNPEIAIKNVMVKKEVLEKNKKLGKLIYHEYAPGSISSNDIKTLIKNIKIKKNIDIDFLVVDYLGLVKPNGKVFSDNTYGVIKTVCEELRALAMTQNICLITATQTGRQSYGSSKIGMEDVSDSIGIAQTCDVMITLAKLNESDNKDNRNPLQEMLVTVAKSRFSKNGSSNTITIDYNNMKLIDSDAAQTSSVFNKEMNKKTKRETDSEEREIVGSENYKDDDDNFEKDKQIDF